MPEEMISHARGQLPDEACGLIAGIENEEEKRIEKVYYLTNTDASNEHFRWIPENSFRQ